jgi:hypothetical protein
MFIYSLKIKTFGNVIKYLNILFHYDIVLDIHLYHLSYVCELDPVAHVRCIQFLFKTGCDMKLKDAIEFSGGCLMNTPTCAPAVGVLPTCPLRDTPRW